MSQPSQAQPRSSRFKRFRQDNASSTVNDNSKTTTQSSDVDIDDVDYMALPLSSFVSNNATPTRTSKQNSDQHDEHSSKNQKLSLSTMMEETRSQGMVMPLSSSNKGFLLLQKKGGFAMGKGLGKDEQGIAEPIKVEVRDKNESTVGIGISAVKKRQQERKELRNVEWNRMREQLHENFLSLASKTHAENKLKKQIKEAIKVIYRLDLERGWFSHQLSEILDELSKLRESGHNPLSDSSAHLKELIERDSTKNDVVVGGDDDGDISNEEAAQRNVLMQRIREATSIMDFVDEPYADTLIDLIDLLRYEHDYCLYCGVRFEDQNDLQQSCPGFFEDDH